MTENTYNGTEAVPEDAAVPADAGPDEIIADEVVADEVIAGEVIAGEVIAGEVEPDAAIELPDDPAEAVEVLKTALAEARAEAARYLDEYRRMAAEFDNFRKRAQRHEAEMIARSSERVVLSLLPVLDSLDAAMAVEPDGEVSEKLLQGMRGTRDQLLAVLAREGLTPIESIGLEFDPELHEAVQAAEGTGTMLVTSELRRGYRFKDRVLRPALVAVGYEENDESE